MVKRKQKTKNVLENDALSFIPTKSSLLRNNKVADFKATIFESHKPKPKTDNGLDDELTKKTSEGTFPERKEIDMKKARFEVIKFGISGFDTKKKEEAKMQIAINLGARPLKNKHKNYKELLEEKKKNQATLEEQKKMQQLGKNTFGASNAKGKSFERKRRKERGEFLEVYGTVKPRFSAKKRKP